MVKNFGHLHLLKTLTELKEISIKVNTEYKNGCLVQERQKEQCFGLQWHSVTLESNIKTTQDVTNITGFIDVHLTYS